MNIAKIIYISPPGRVWSGPSGPLTPFTVTFDDNQSGEANAKTNPPPYKIGDVVGYDITGQTPRGANKIKITRNPDMSMGRLTSPPPMDTSNPDLEAAPGYARTHEPQKPPQNRPAAPSHTGAPKSAEHRISEMSSLYVECLKGARHVVSLAFTEATPEDTRNIATALFIQATREGLKAESEPF